MTKHRYDKHDILPLIKYVLRVTVHLNLLSVIKKFLQMSHFLQLIIVRLLLMLGLEYKEYATISFRFLLRLQITENVLFGKAFFKTPSECR